MAQTLRALVVKLSADVAELQTGLAKGEQQTSRFQRNVESNARSIKRSFDAIGTAVRAATSAFALFGVARLATQQLEFADKIGDAAARLGVQVEALSRLDVAARQTDSSVEELISGMTFLARRGADVTAVVDGTKTSLEDLGISAQDPIDGLFKLLDAMAALPNEAQKIEAASQLFGRGAAESIANILTDLDGFKARFAAAQATVTTDSAKVADQLEKDYARVSSSIARGFQSAIVSVADFVDTAGRGVEVAARFFGIVDEAPKPHVDLTKIDPESLPINKGIIQRAKPEIVAEAKSAGEQALEEFLKALADDTKIDDATKKISKAIQKVRDTTTAQESQDIAARLSSIEDQFASPVALLVKQRDRLIGELNDIAFQNEEFQTTVDRLIEEVTEGTQKQIDDLGKPIAKAQTAFDLFSQQAAASLQSNLGSTLSQIFQGNFDGILQSWEKLLADMVAELLARKILLQLFGSSFGQTGTPASGGFSTFLKGIGLEPRASGGPVQAGQPYLVGEHGQEMFVPETAGYILPKSNGGGSFSVVNNVTVSGGASRESLAALDEALRRNNERIRYQVFDMMRRRLAPV